MRGTRFGKVLLMSTNGYLDCTYSYTLVWVDSPYKCAFAGLRVRRLWGLGQTLCSEALC